MASRPATAPDRKVFLYFSEVVGRKVLDADEREVGRLWDLSIDLGDPFPVVNQILVRPDRSEVLLIGPGNVVVAWRDRPLRLSVRLSDLRPGLRRDRDELLVREALLDKQVVDVSGAKVERVNDVSFLIVKENEIRLAHIDVGLRGLVRRLGWEPFVDRIVSLLRPGAKYLSNEPLIGWKYVVPTLDDPAGLRLALSQKSLAKLHPADLADILEDLPTGSRRTVFDVLELDTAARVLSEVTPEVQGDLLATEATPRGRPTCSRPCRRMRRPTSFRICRPTRRRT